MHFYSARMSARLLHGEEVLVGADEVGIVEEPARHDVRLGEGVVERGVEAPVRVSHAFHEERVLADAAAEADTLGVEPALDVVNLQGNLVAHNLCA